MLAGLTGCLETTEPHDADGPDLLIFIVDTAGAAVAADTVTWSYYGDSGMAHHKMAVRAHGDDSTHKAAVRGNAEGTLWTVTDPGLHASIFLRASYHRTIDALCMDHGYAIREINANTLPQEVTLVLKVARMCE